MKTIKILNGKVFVNGKETKKASEIGNAILDDIQNAERDVKRMMSDYNYLISLINLKSENELLHSWLVENHFSKKECFPKTTLQSFRPNSVTTQTLINFVSAYNNGYLIVNPNHKKSEE